ncbi:MAG TPA: creatininase family protein [Bryobacteraceae bacterium]|nr:creatininase family protein [Bryobacteraceae bacterium]
MHRLRIPLVVAIAAVALQGQNLPSKWEELTAGDFVKALQKSQNTCLLPFGIIEKHGPQLPLGTDLINVRWIAEHAVEQEYSIVFPAYYFGQIFEARHEPGTMAYSAKMQLELLQETTDEMARNGCRKIMIVNGHGGNNSLLPYFAQTQLATKHDYVVYLYRHGAYPPGRPQMHSKTDSHAGESETAHTLVSRPDLVHLDRASSENGSDRNRLDLPPSVYTGIWWYAKFPDHYAGDGAVATKELGEFDMKSTADDLANAIRAIKADQVSPRLQDEFFGKTPQPTQTKQ